MEYAVPPNQLLKVLKNLSPLLIMGLLQIVYHAMVRVMLIEFSAPVSTESAKCDLRNDEHVLPYHRCWLSESKVGKQVCNARSSAQSRWVSRTIRMYDLEKFSRVA